ncbi:hypothetical protein K2173_026821 [Erythroxylum novogranatense]|uniref:Chlororespiratory reduction 21 n=1 Tax=Erythroxylum novogranatense TaxID=1862640 RepID=A0AAV8U0I0_9ROSI|nr:hypothetical protein K2173_026821 [Erythroxylum novogranatense]
MRLTFLIRALPTSNLHSVHQQLCFSTIGNESSFVSRTPKPHIYVRLLQNCLRDCKQVKSRKLFDEMPETVFRASVTNKLVHAQVVKLGFLLKRSLGNAILDLYAKCDNVEDAEKLFYRLEHRDILAWNSIISMYSRRGSPNLALNSFGYLWDGGLRPNDFTVVLALSACARMVNVECGRRLHCLVLKMGFESSSFCEGALIDMYSKSNSMNDARRVFDGAVELDTVSWTSMIAGYVQVGLPMDALKVFEQMEKVGLKPDQVAYVTLINVFINLGRLDDASELFNQMPNPNVVAWNLMISGHAQRGYAAEAIMFFQNLRKAGLKSTRSTLGSVLSAIATLATLDLGLLVHAEAIKLGLLANVYVGSSLISMYAKCKKMEAARKVFDAVDGRNVVLWNSILGGYAQNGCAIEVITLFSSLGSCGLHADDFTYTSVLSACACLEYLEVGRQLHSVIIKNNFASNLFVGNALVDMYAKSGVLDDSRRQFERMRNRDNISWNAIIVGYVQKEHESEAFHMFQQMNLCGILPDEVSLSSVMSACANVKDDDKGKQVHCLSVKSGLATSLFAGSSLVDMYVKCGDVDSAHKILIHMPQRSVASMNALIAGYAPTDVEKAIMLFRQMQDENLKPSDITFVSLLDACDEPKKLNLGRQIHCLVLKMGIHYDNDFLGVSLLGMYMNSLSKTDATMLFSGFSNLKSTIIWTAMISGFAQNGCCDEALQYYKKMRSCSILPDQATFVSVLRACAVLSSITVGRQIHSHVLHTGYHYDELTCSSLVDMYAKCGDVMSSMQVFEEMDEKNDVISWNSMIVGFAKNGYAEEALNVFHDMMLKDVLPDDVTFLGILTACSHAGMVTEGRQIYDIMVNYYWIQPRVEHCACMVDLLGRWGFLKEAEEFIDKLNFEPNSMIWATMLGACRIHGDDIRGQLATEKLIDLEPENSSPYVLLSNIYAASGNWKEADSLRKSMREQKVKKPPGCSWIIVGQKTHLFIAGDNCHPSAAKIGVVLKHLKAVMKADSNIAQIDSFYLDDE